LRRTLAGMSSTTKSINQQLKLIIKNSIEY
jgi:hypothetical protein